MRQLSYRFIKYFGGGCGLGLGILQEAKKDGWFPIFLMVLGATIMALADTALAETPTKGA